MPEVRICVMKVLFVSIYYDTEAGENDEWLIEFTDLGKEAFAKLTDFELKVAATELGLRIRNSVELPPSPKL